MSDPIRRGGNRRRNPARQEGTETSLSIMNFRNQIQDLARPNLFQVSLDFPDIDGGDSGRPDGGRDRGRGRNGRRGRNRNQDRNLSTFLVKAANLPASTIGVIEVPFRGRVLKIAGDRTFDSWTVTVLNDTDFSIRSAFERWMNTINRVSDNTGLVNPADYQADAYVYQLDRDGSVLRSYRFYDVFPTQVAPIELSYDAQGIQEFTVELQVQWWEAAKGTGANAGGEDIN